MKFYAHLDPNGEGFEYDTPEYRAAFQKNIKDETVASMYHATCDDCNKEMDVFIDEDGNDGSIAILCRSCYEAAKAAIGKGGRVSE